MERYGEVENRGGEGEASELRTMSAGQPRHAKSAGQRTKPVVKPMAVVMRERLHGWAEGGAPGRCARPMGGKSRPGRKKVQLPMEAGKDSGETRRNSSPFVSCSSAV